ncbi:trypsin-like serine protease [Allosaccharopolyspora coralli]|uniref:Trypsin-like serine protease n=1 Tax=Allosaccharopolyspora coralli TaxID=2665642 RepID=A0A5Q3QAL7_9PSEU|nr:S1 family peptidase [Allosaccharopolyspora coralli]QGK68515.1 trypsin-like serine protease [Allosaccharopolyspora coralli]
MRRRLAARLAGSVFLAAGVVGAFTVPATANPTETMPQGALDAMQRDLGLTADQAEQRIAQEAVANDAFATLSSSLGQTYGGSHFDAATGKLVVGVTDQSAFDQVRAADATPVLVDDSERHLNATADALSAAADRQPEGVTGWYVDPASNQVVLTTAFGTAADAAGFVESSDADATSVDVVESAEQPRLLEDVIGGNPYFIGSGSRCSIGFSVEGGFVTAGHCGSTGDSTSQPSGTFAGSSFPGDDHGYVEVSSATPVGQVNDYSGGTVAVAGSQESAVGSSVCRSGSTTGWYCGTIEATNQSVSYPQGTVNGLVRTDVCAEPGDSGGSFISGDQAQGMTSGGSGNCSLGGTTYYQPVNEALDVYGLTLVTG